MRTSRLGLFVVICLFFAGSTVLFGGGNLVAHLSGDQEAPPVDTKAQGQAIFKLRGDSLSYKLIVANLDKIVAAHIHCAPEGSNGPVGVTLFAGSPVDVNGILAQGPLVAPDSENFCFWEDLDDVIEALETGDTYVNVHTLDHLPGEVRGQIR